MTPAVKNWKLSNDSTKERIQEWEEIRERLQTPIRLPHAVNLHLIRHAESKVNADKRVTGLQDVELTADGERQAKDVSTKLFKYYDLAFTSGLKRAGRTLEIALESGDIKVADLVVDNRLNERSLGVLEGQKFRWIPEYADGDLKYAPEKGENYESVARRILSFLIELADYTVETQIRHILISSHMGPMRIMVGILKQEEDPVTVLGLKFPNTQVIKLTWDRLEIPGFLKNV